VKTNPTQRLTTGTRIAYGAGELGPAMAGSTLIFYQLIFLTNVAGLSPGLAGSVLLVGKAWDAVNDPLIGWLSDHTRTRWGRRLPWMMACAFPFALAFFLMWYVPGFASSDNQWGLFAYYSLVAIVFNSVYTGMALPHSALTAELSHDYDERSRIAASRMAFSLGGSVGGLLLALGAFELAKKAPNTVQYALLGGSVSIVALIAVAICIVGIWKPVLAADRERRERERLNPQRSLSLLKQFTVAFSNKPFVMVCGIYLASWLAMQFTASILPFYVTSVMGQKETMFQLLALTVQVTALAMIPAWSWLSVRVGKRWVYFYAMPLWLIAQAGLLFLQPGQTVLMFVLGFIAGFGISVCYLIPNAMLPDTIEYDEVETGQRREGIFYGVFVFLQKMGLALATFVLGQVLAIAGYIESGPGAVAPTQPESALLAIRLAIGPLPAVAIVIGIFLVWKFPITKEKHNEIRRQLRKMRGETED